jgi:hypothetical protein
MFEDSAPPDNSVPGGIWRKVAVAAAVAYVVASAFLIFETRSRLETLEKAQRETTEKLTRRIAGTENSLKGSTEALAQRVGMTEQDLKARMAARAAELERQQQAAEKRLAEQQKEQIGHVSGEVASVRTELGGARSDIAATRTDLEATRQKLERTIGDLGLQSGLIARTRDELEQLKHRGDRNYYEFSLEKGARPTPVSTVSLQLKKTDQKKNKFNLNVIADDLTIEKKDRSVFEPLQFYTGRDRQLYEIVVLKVEKNRIFGYLTTPKSVPSPLSRN